MASYRPRHFYLILSLWLALFCFDVIAVQNGSNKARSSKKMCSDVLMRPQSPYTASFIKLAEKAFISGLISKEDFESSALADAPLNPIRSVRSVESQIFHEGFASLLTNSATLDWPWIQNKIMTLIEDKEQIIEKETVQIQETKLRFAPHISRQMPTPATSITSQATFFISQDGRELVAFSTKENWAYILDLNDPKGAIKIPIGSAGLSKPVHFLTKQGMEGVAFASEDGNLFIVDLENPKKPRKIDIGHRVYSDPVFFSVLDGRDFIAIGSDDYCIYLIDLDTSVEPLCVPTNGKVRNSIVHHRTKDQTNQKDLLIAGSLDGHIYLIDMLTPEKPKIMDLAAEVWSSPSVFETPDGRELISVGTKNQEFRIIDLNRARAVKKIPANGFPRGASSYFVRSDGQQVISTAASGIFTISPLNGSKPIHQVDLHQTLDSDPVSFSTTDQKEIVALAIPGVGVLFTNLNDPSDRVEIQFDRANSIQKIRRKNGKEQILVSPSESNILYFLDLYQENSSKELQ